MVKWGRVGPLAGTKYIVRPTFFYLWSVVLVFAMFHETSVFTHFGFLIGVVGVFVSSAYHGFVGLRVYLVGRLNYFFGTCLVRVNVRAGARFLNGRFSRMKAIMAGR